MANVRKMLQDDGLSAEEIEVMLGNPKYTASLEKMAKQAEDGVTAYQKAQEIETNLKNWNEREVVPYVAKADAATREAIAENAKLKTYMQNLKAQGYEVPDSYLEGAPVVNNPATPPAPVSNGRNYDEELVNATKANMALIAANERARELLGHGLDIEHEYEDFSKNRRTNENLRNYIDRKYDLTAKETERAATKKKDYEQSIRDEAVKSAREEWMKSNGSNPETRNPKMSRFDQIKDERVAADRGNSWQTAAGREAARKERVAKYAGMVQ